MQAERRVQGLEQGRRTNIARDRHHYDFKTEGRLGLATQCKKALQKGMQIYRYYHNHTHLDG